jgi:protein transport protein SEC23
MPHRVVPVCNAQVMIQPQLSAYHFGGPPEAVLLDVQSILPERILLLDAFFYGSGRISFTIAAPRLHSQAQIRPVCRPCLAVVTFHGTTIAKWRKAEYHLQAEHAAFAQLLAAPHAEAKDIARRYALGFWVLSGVLCNIIRIQLHGTQRMPACRLQALPSAAGCGL